MNIEDHYRYMSQFLTEERQQRFNDVLSRRTRNAVAVLENTVKEQNASAVIRTLDALGFHEVHLVEKDWKVKLNAMISKGSDKWLDLQRSADMKATLKGLKERGFLIAATCPHQDGIELKDLKTDQPIAVVFGNEWDGISEAVQDHTDVFMQIPMYGFVESYNLSVSVGMVFSHLRWEMERNNTLTCLTEKEKMKARLRWAIRSSGSGRKLYARWLEKHGEPDLSV